MEASQALEKLKGGNLRSIGKSNEVVRYILNSPALFGGVFTGLFHEDPVIRMRSADGIEKVTKVRPMYLQPYKDRLIKDVTKINQEEVCRRLAQMFSCLELNREEKMAVAEILCSWIDSEKSKIVIVNSLHTMAKFAKEEQGMRPVVKKDLTISSKMPALQW